MPTAMVSLMFQANTLTLTLASSAMCGFQMCGTRRPFAASYPWRPSCCRSLFRSRRNIHYPQGNLDAGGLPAHAWWELQVSFIVPADCLFTLNCRTQRPPSPPLGRRCRRDHARRCRSPRLGMPAGGLPPPSDEAEDAVSSSGRGAVFVLENAGLETAKVGKVRRAS